MCPNSYEVLNAIRWTFDSMLAPALPASDELAQSYARTLSFLLKQLDARLRNESKALYEEWQDLRSVLAKLRPALNGALVDSIDAVLKEDIVIDWMISGAIYEKVTNLRGLLVESMKTLPSQHDSHVREYLARQLERDSRSLNIPFSSNPI